MQWIELSLDTTNEAVDWVCTLVAETINIDDVQITEYAELNQAQWTFTIRLYLAYDVHSRARVEKIINLLSPLHRTGLATAIQTTVVDQKPTNADILNPPVHRIGKRFVVLTPDALYQSQAADEITLRLKTTLSFGSGLHPATIVSLQMLERYVLPTMNVLDLGSGSGILSVAIAKLGANVLALDNDSIAVDATQDAVYLNGVEQQVTVTKGSLGCGSDLGHWMGGDTIDNVPKIEARNKFDLIVANILARMHIALANDFQRALRQTDAHPGLLITAGFTTDNEDNVAKALTEVGFELVGCERLNEWVALTHRLKV
ncbi:50S ribosomal protein L11 methyltransferase [Komarekiella sp. 'clone 1']|uniref:50S ribosomal protein L11 methyltransferase n=1 Tax=Komarekiella delphini-convector SJRDD-AB1 TaxID=2593771 RepID=A0AA40T1T9_9NOST|nr:50S ribosomal protein L11 methyltransferase [Komarekiella delphini-convector]MBD6619354.1 50S ribosomal protein L11 methyltransferase [Komarekiella delphini-convector SJRDD-AB1]